MTLLMALQALPAVVFFFCFLWLALRGRYPPRWRRAFGLLAVTPIISWLLLTVLSATRSFGGASPASALLPYAASPAAQSLILGAAMVLDLRAGARRHWSHWLAATARTLLLGLFALWYAAWIFFPEQWSR